MAKPHNDPNAAVKLAFAALLAVIILAMIAGCSTVKAVVDACRDGLCR